MCQLLNSKQKLSSEGVIIWYSGIQQHGTPSSHIIVGPRGGSTMSLYSKEYLIIFPSEDNPFNQ